MQVLCLAVETTIWSSLVPLQCPLGSLKRADQDWKEREGKRENTTTAPQASTMWLVAASPHKAPTP